MCFPRILAAVLAISVELAQGCQTEFFRSGEALSLRGCISAASATEFLRRLPESGGEVIIDSEGGSVEAAIEMATSLNASGRPLRIRGRCKSSCANYLLAAARLVRVEPGAEVVFHGDATLGLARLKPGTLGEEAMRQVSRIEGLEWRFRQRFARAQQIHLIQSIVLGAGNEWLQIELDGLTVSCRGLGLTVWSPSIQTLQRFGLVHELVEGTETWAGRATVVEQGSPDGEEFHPFDGCISASGH